MTGLIFTCFLICFELPMPLCKAELVAWGGEGKSTAAMLSSKTALTVKGQGKRAVSKQCYRKSVSPVQP